MKSLIFTKMLNLKKVMINRSNNKKKKIKENQYKNKDCQKQKLMKMKKKFHWKELRLLWKIWEFQKYNKTQSIHSKLIINQNQKPKDLIWENFCFSLLKNSQHKPILKSKLSIHSKILEKKLKNYLNILIVIMVETYKLVKCIMLWKI